MRISTSKELRSRVDAIYKKHVESWLKAHPLPELPVPALVMVELETGKARIHDLENLKLALNWAQGYNQEPVFNDVSVFDCITTPSIEKARAGIAQRQADFQKYRVRLDERREALLDRVIFDGDAPYPLLEAFRQWKDSSSTGEPFDGP